MCRFCWFQRLLRWHTPLWLHRKRDARGGGKLIRSQKSYEYTYTHTSSRNAQLPAPQNHSTTRKSARSICWVVAYLTRVWRVATHIPDVLLQPHTPKATPSVACLPPTSDCNRPTPCNPRNRTTADTHLRQNPTGRQAALKCASPCWLASQCCYPVSARQRATPKFEKEGCSC